MPSRRRRPATLPDHHAAEVVRALRSTRDVLTRASMSVTPYGESGAALSAAVLAICRAADVLTGRDGYFHTGSSATEGQLARNKAWDAWERGEVLDKPT